jgi:protein-S-isoprenylcysteine O-methyltransferase Ste14
LTGDQTASLIAAILCLVLVASSLAVRRLELASWVRLALVWAAIFAAAVVIISWWTGRAAESWVSNTPSSVLQFT